MRRIRVLGLTLLAVCALGAFTSSAAQAAEGPLLRIGGAKLQEGIETAEGAVTKEFVLKNGVQTIKCTGAQLMISWEGVNTVLARGWLWTLYKGCSVTGNGAACEPYSEKRAGTVEAAHITTRPVFFTLIFTNSSATKGEKLLVFLESAKNNIFVELKFKGTCTLTTATVEGSVIGEYLNETKEAVKFEETETEGEKGFIEFPTTQIKAGFEEKEKGKRDEVKASIKTFGKAATVEGQNETKLASKEKFAVVAK